MSQAKDAPSIISPEQCRAARAVLRMTFVDTTTAADVSEPTLAKFEAGGEVRHSIASRLRAAFEARGVVFVPDGRGVSW